MSYIELLGTIYNIYIYTEEETLGSLLVLNKVVVQ
jgi:hypothetical protein